MIVRNEEDSEISVTSLDADVKVDSTEVAGAYPKRLGACDVAERLTGHTGSEDPMAVLRDQLEAVDAQARGSQLYARFFDPS